MNNKNSGPRTAGLYLKSGYLNYKSIINNEFPFTIIYGGRGIGKTYGILQYAVKNKIKFIYMRRSQSMVDQLANDALNPIKSVASDLGLISGAKKRGKYIAELYATDGEIKEASPAGIMVALSTFANLRGFDASEYKLLIYDEFIPQENEKRISGEGTAFLNAIETINRNREIQGGDAILVFMLTNANTLNSDLLLSLNLFEAVLNLQEKDLEVYKNKERGLQIIKPDSIISEQKKATALYRFAGSGSFADMAINNKFSMPDANIKSIDIHGARVIFKIPEMGLCCYRKSNIFYITKHTSGVPKYSYIFDKKGLIRFGREQTKFILALTEGRVFFQTLELFYILTNALNLI